MSRPEIGFVAPSAPAGGATEERPAVFEGMAAGAVATICKTAASDG
jgi:hypothetical protein